MLKKKYIMFLMVSVAAMYSSSVWSSAVCGREELLSAKTVDFTDKTFYMHKKLQFITNWMKEKSSRLFKLIATEIIVLCLHRAAAEI